MALKDDLLRQLDSLITEATRLDESFSMMNMGTTESDVPEHVHQAFAVSAKAAIARIAGSDSEYYKPLPEFGNDVRIIVAGYGSNLISPIRGALVALRSAVDQGWLESLESKLRANVHDDFLDQANVLLESAYHVAAMVLIGGVLEDHLCKLCNSRGFSWIGSGSLSKYNDLLKGDAYDQPVWRRIQAVSDVRNDAAHGLGIKIKLVDVKDAQQYISRFLADYPS